MSEEGLREARLLTELTALRRRVAELEKSAAERKPIETAIEESKKRYRFISETISNFAYSCIKPREGEYVIDWMAGAVVPITGYSINEIKEWGCWKQMVHPDFSGVFEENVLGLLPGAAGDCEFQIIRKDGVIRWIRSLARCVASGQDQATRMLYGACEDITERRHAEEVLRESEKKYRLLVENAGEGIFVTQEGMIKFSNAKTSEIAGYAKEELISVPFIEFIHPEDRAMVLDRHIKRQQGREVPSSYSFRIIDKSGNVRWVDINVVLMDWEGKSATLNFLTDITNLKLAEDALKESEQKYRLVFNNTPLGMLHFDSDGVITACNDPFVNIIGSSREMLIGLDMLNLPDFHIVRAVKNALNGHPGFYEGEYESVTAKKKTWVKCLFAPVRLDNDQYLGGTGIIEDITARRWSEEALRKSEARFRSYFELPLIGIAITSPERGWLEVNDRLSAMLGYSRQQLKDMTWSELTHPDDLAADIEQFNRLLAGKIDSYMMDKRFIRKDGEIIWISLAVGCVHKQDGTVDYILALLQDITARKESMERISKTLGAAVQAVAVTVETRDPYTAGHQRRTADLARAIAVEMDLPADRIEGIRMAAVIHDLGKISVPVEILSKPTKLTSIEFSLIKIHAESGYNILKDIDFPWPIARIVLEHHERMDGSGYPNGLKGEQSLLESRVLAVADVVESMASHRPYRPALGLDKALEEIARNRGALYDPTVVAACLRLFQEKGYRLVD